MEEIVVYIGEHASSSLEGMVGSFNTSFLISILVSSVTGEDSRNIEYNARFFIRKGVLGRWFKGKGIKPVGAMLDKFP